MNKLDSFSHSLILLLTSKSVFSFSHSLIDFLLEEAAEGNTPNGKMKKDNWPFVTDEFNNRTRKHYSLLQIKGKLKRLKKRYCAFFKYLFLSRLSFLLFEHTKPDFFEHTEPDFDQMVMRTLLFRI